MPLSHLEYILTLELNVIMSIALTVLPRKYASLAKFKELVDTHKFKVSDNCVVGMVVEEAEEEFPLHPLCNECATVHTSSGIIGQIKGIQWQMVGASTYDPAQTVSCILRNPS